MLNLIKAEFYKIKKSWLLYLSIGMALFFPILTMLMVKSSTQANAESETVFIQLIRQNHIFLTLLICNIFFVLISTDLFYKEYQHKTVLCIISVPIKRVMYIVAKQITLFVWMFSYVLMTYLTCVLIGLLSGMDGLTIPNLLMGLNKYILVVLISFVPLQFYIWITLMFRNFFVPLGVAVVGLVGTIIAFNTTDFIFYYPFSLSFVLTNFQKSITTNNIMASLIALAFMSVFFILSLITFNQKDL
jgi:hypothetical protein